MKYFEKLGVLDTKSPESIAKYFASNPHLSKEKIGEFFGEEAELNVQSLTCFTNNFDFRNMIPDDALRIYLASFDLPGEGQKIDRIV
mmetsp:Transcript_16230/g.13811  ORF Transcript_16230/g.13811 Transcript_16230/m.13811 type:complete len:87 (-) Transcript_16230:3358-3618(-)